MISELMEQKHMTKYQLAKNSGIPYTTVSDICSGKAQLEKCTAETVYKLSKELDVSMETLLLSHSDKRNSFELFKSNVCHTLKEQGDLAFIIHALETDDIRKYYSRKWYRESLYLLAMLDYLCRINDVPLCNRYDDIRCCKLEETIYPTGVIVLCAVAKNDRSKEQALKESIPEFRRFNIIESEVRNVV